jgi:hypothetical protein
VRQSSERDIPHPWRPSPEELARGRSEDRERDGYCDDSQLRERFSLLLFIPRMGISGIVSVAMPFGYQRGTRDPHYQADYYPKVLPTVSLLRLALGQSLTRFLSFYLASLCFFSKSLPDAPSSCTLQAIVPKADRNLTSHTHT